MLVKVMKSKLVLGRNSYKKDDVFECRDQEATLLIAGGLIKEMPAGTKATVESPKPPSTGISLTKKKAESLKTVPAPPITRKRFIPPVRKVITESPIKKSVESEPKDVAEDTPPSPPAGNPIGAMTQPEGRWPPSANPTDKSEG